MSSKHTQLHLILVKLPSPLQYYLLLLNLYSNLKREIQLSVRHQFPREGVGKRNCNKLLYNMT